MPSYGRAHLRYAHAPYASVCSFTRRQHVLYVPSQGMRWVPIQDPAVKHVPGWDVWDAGAAAGVYVRDDKGEKPYWGQVSGVLG